MSGYLWAKTPENELFVVLVIDGKGYVPGLENAINLDEFFFLGPVQWPELTPQSQNSAPPKCGALVPDATPASNILAFVANG